MQPIQVSLSMSEFDARKICVSLGSNAADECDLLHKIEAGEITLVSKRIVKDSICHSLRIILDLETRFGMKLQDFFRDAQGSIDMVEVR